MPVRRDTAREKLRVLREDIAQRLDSLHGSDRKKKVAAAAASSQRRLQSIDVNDVCTSTLGPNVFSFNGLVRWSPSFWQNCAESYTVDADNMILHLESLNDLSRQYHVFYDLAIDPANSDPAEYQPELGNEILRDGEGVVDINAELTAIIDQVTAEGRASMATFWDIDQAFFQFRDGHVSPPALDNEGAGFPSYVLHAIPERFSGLRSSLSISTVPSFQLDANRRLTLNMTYTVIDEDIDEEISREEVTVDMINGMSVHDFILDLASNPAMPLATPTIGARVNIIVSLPFIFDVDVFPIFSTNPMGILPDTFQVTYTDGGMDEFVTMVRPYAFIGSHSLLLERVDGTLYVGFDRTEVETSINAPGAQFDAYVRSISAVSDDFGQPARKLLEKDEAKLPDRQLQSMDDETSEVAFEGYALDEDVYVIKISSFSVADYLVFFENWRTVLLEANQGGQTKLLIDLSNNGGGEVVRGKWFLRLLKLIIKNMAFLKLLTHCSTFSSLLFGRSPDAGNRYRMVFEPVGYQLE